MDQSTFVEKRNQKRFRVQEGTFAALKNHEAKLGVIQDISRSGLAFKYVAQGNVSNGSGMIEVVFEGKNHYLENVPVEIISDVEMVEKPSFSFIPMRRCGLQFKKMTPFQISQVEEFIEEYALQG